MSKKKETKKEKIKFFLNEAKYYNNAGQYKKAVANIKLAYSVWEGYKDLESNKAKKMLDKIIFARETIIHNYLTVRERKIRAIIGD